MKVNCDVTVEQRFEPPLEFRHDHDDFHVTVADSNGHTAPCIFGCSATSAKTQHVVEAKTAVYQSVANYQALLVKALDELRQHYGDVAQWLVANEASRPKD